MTKWCVKDCVCVKVVCDKDVGDKVVCERWCAKDGVTKCCVKVGVSKDERGWVKNWCEKDGV